MAAQRGLLRLATVGSVDDGKSTLIGRLLYDSKAILEDQLAQVEQASQRRGGAEGRVDLSLLTDGLRAEREQGITIDVAHRYFATARRDFIIADCPGHEQYTRNMVVGASTADLALVLLDARRGMTSQSRRHAFIASLLRVPHIVVCVNKMDLVGFSEEVYERLQAQFADWAAKLDVADVTFIPVSALEGDNIVERSPRMPWYDGPSLLYHLEHVHIASDRNLIDCRFPVQWVLRPGAGTDYRAYGGKVEAGVFKQGDEVMVLPSGVTTTIEGIDTYDGELEEAYPPLSVAIRLADQVDASRGDMICRPGNQPTSTRELEAMVCWMHENPLQLRGRYAVKHTTRWVKALVDDIRYRVDVDTLHRDQEATGLGLNEIGRVRLRLGDPLLVDSYRRNRATGSFLIVDEQTNDTVGAGVVLDT